jgi:RNA-directed DNA polymerase
MTWAGLRREAPALLPQLARQLADGSWQPGPLREVEIMTYTGKTMPTSIPPVVDRLVHRAMRNAVEPILEARAFQDWVSGFRPGRSRITALRQAAAHRQVGYSWVADLDVASVSAGAQVCEAIDWFAEYIHDGTFLARLRTALGAMPEPITPGSGLAPLLINLRLSQVDRLLGEFRVVRFADNYAVFAGNQHDAERAFFAVSDALLRMRLCPNEHKSRIRADVNVEDLFLIGG